MLPPTVPTESRLIHDCCSLHQSSEGERTKMVLASLPAKRQHNAVLQKCFVLYACICFVFVFKVSLQIPCYTKYTFLYLHDVTSSGFCRYVGTKNGKHIESITVSTTVIAAATVWKCYAVSRCRYQ